jgi:fibrillarin-like rRNA methylase
VSKSTTLREERLRKVKSNIEAMQKKMGNKNATGKTESNRGAVYREVISVGSKGYRQEESRQSEAGFGNYDRGL